MNEELILKSLLLMKAAYPRLALSDETIQLYTRALQDIEPALLKAAVMHHIASSKWFPTIAELREAAAHLLASASGQPSAYDAWGAVMRQVRLRGRWGVPDLEPLAQQAVNVIGGWSFICDSENVTADRARFIAAYEQLLERKVRQQMELPIVTEYKKGASPGRRLSG